MTPHPPQRWRQAHRAGFTLFHRAGSAAHARQAHYARLLTLGTLDTVAVSPARAESLYHGHPEWQAGLLLVHGARCWHGKAVWGALPRVLAESCLHKLRHALRRPPLKRH